MKNTKNISALIVAAHLAVSYSCTTREYTHDNVREMSVNATKEAKAAFDTTQLVRTIRK